MPPSSTATPAWADDGRSGLRRHHGRGLRAGGSGGRQWNGGAVASQEVIKELGTNGGGYFNANSAPTPSRTRPRSRTCSRSS
ncbi:potassium-transporting ATPase subunit KdpA [Streptomyces sp. LN699]|uniref:potassium-transporting ATPase subunit KdpA n=1 Tax=Streptomyces sp. LN699 TaxID=3112981 RepID=UPI0037120489